MLIFGMERLRNRGNRSFLFFNFTDKESLLERVDVNRFFGDFVRFGIITYFGDWIIKCNMDLRVEEFYLFLFWEEVIVEEEKKNGVVFERFDIFIL